MIKAVVRYFKEDKPDVVSRPVIQSLAVTLGGAPYEPELSPGDDDYELHVPANSIDKKDADTPDAWVLAMIFASSKVYNQNKRGLFLNKLPRTLC